MPRNQEYEDEPLFNDTQPVDEDDAYERDRQDRLDKTGRNTTPDIPPMTEQEHVRILHLQFDYWNEHPDHGSEDWIQAVREGNTRRSYWEWVAHQIEEHA